MKIVLASGSPRRKELISIICSSFEIRPSQADETLPKNIATEKAAEYLAKVKAEAAEMNSGETVIGCDTVVAVDGEILGKPHDREDCRRMLKMLSGRSHFVYTGVCIRGESGVDCFTEKTEVTFYPLTDNEIEEYMDSGEPFDKAGGYGIQGKGSVFVKGIKGDYFNVVGLPVARLYRELRKQSK